VNNRILILATAVFSIGILALGWFIGVSPRLTELSSNAASLVSTQEQIRQYEADLAVLKTQYEDIDTVRAELEQLRASLPVDGDFPDLMRQIEQLATASAVSIKDYSLATPIVYGAAEGETTPATGSEISGGTLLAIPLSITVDGANAETVFAFIKSMQLGQRLFLVTDFTLTVVPAEKGPASVTVVVNALVYSLLDPNAAVPDPAAAEAAPAETPAPVETPVAEATPTPTPTP